MRVFFTCQVSFCLLPVNASQTADLVMLHLAAALCCRHGKGANASHDIQHDVCGPEGLHQAQMLMLQPGVPIHLSSEGIPARLARGNRVQHGMHR